jgi:hypothetical protein
MDLEAVEGAIRAAALLAGAKVLEALLGDVGVGRRGEPVLCGLGCGAAMDSSGVRGKAVDTLMGPIWFERSRYTCPRCRKARYPGDEELGICGTSRSPGLQRQTARLGAKETFREVARDLRELAGVEISPKDAERISEAVGEDVERRDRAERKRLYDAASLPSEAPTTEPNFYIEIDGTGVPMTTEETAGRKGKQKDGTAKTREAKLGCVFTQTAFDDEGRPIRNPASTSFTGAIENSAVFGRRIFAEAVRRGYLQARRVVILSDGAEWIKTIARDHFSNAIHIIDLYHAREHLVELCKLLSGQGLKRFNRCKDRWWEDLDAGNIEKIIEEAQASLPRNATEGKDARQQIGYFEKNKERMRYKAFKDQGYFLGSGVIEAGCKTIVGQRLKQSGMEWSVRGANAIIALRCMEASGRTEDYWETRAA